MPNRDNALARLKTSAVGGGPVVLFGRCLEVELIDFYICHSDGLFMCVTVRQRSPDTLGRDHRRISSFLANSRMAHLPHPG